jgi:uncharacterized protein
MIEMNVFGLALDEDTQAPVLILKDKEDKTSLPIWIGAMEAMAISITLNQVKLPRPMTHDLLLGVIGAMGGKLRHIEVTDLREGTYFARIIVDQGDRILEIDSRPSDAVALALRAGAPILVSRQVFDLLGESKMKTATLGEDSEKWSDILERFNLDDTKYKM